MIRLLITIFIFCIVLFMYLHIQFHFKTSDDLEIFEIEQASKDRMEEICDLRQPILFDLEPEHHNIIKYTNSNYILDNYPMFEIKIRESLNEKKDEELYVPLPFHDAIQLFKKDTESKYFSENNADFLTETGLKKTMQKNDEYLRPSLISNSIYDIMLGSKGNQTPFRYEMNYRNFFMVTQGSIRVKLTPPKNKKYLYATNDYDNYEFKSPVNPWNVQEKYKQNFDKMKCLDMILAPGKCFYIPAYWWYSFQFEEDTSVSCFYYRTYMNNISIMPHLFMYTLQNLNIQRKTIQPANIAVEKKKKIKTKKVEQKEEVMKEPTKIEQEKIEI